MTEKNPIVGHANDMMKVASKIKQIGWDAKNGELNESDKQRIESYLSEIQSLVWVIEARVK